MRDCPSKANNRAKARWSTVGEKRARGRLDSDDPNTHCRIYALTGCPADCFFKRWRSSSVTRRVIGEACFVFCLPCCLEVDDDTKWLLPEKSCRSAPLVFLTFLVVTALAPLLDGMPNWPNARELGDLSQELSYRAHRQGFECLFLQP